MRETDARADERLVVRGADLIHRAFEALELSLGEVTSRARRQFERRAWRELQASSERRLDLYSETLDRLEADVRRMLSGRVEQQELWRRMRQAYAGKLVDEQNYELAQTFFNSVTRRIFSTVGVNPEIEFVGRRSALSDLSSRPGIYRRFDAREPLDELLVELLASYRFAARWCDLARDATRVARQVERRLGRGSRAARFDTIEMLRSVFFRNKGAYLIGRIRRELHVIPFVVALTHGPDGIEVDAALLEQHEVSIVFSFTRSYFLVETDCPRQLIVFLKSIMPLKPIADLYTSLGFNKHGKTELYRSLRRHLDKYDDRFEIAPGDVGMVMLVFTLAGFDMVFKVIRDRFAPPKQTSHAAVMERYRLVFKHDRVGRLIDAHEFEHLTFARQLFSERLLDELLRHAGQTVEPRGDEVVIHHLYAERKVTPLNIYLRRADRAAAERAVIDYGNAIKELAAANIFPGDFLLKNFGVTRHGRVVFYDYDELCLLETCRFRALPPPRVPEDEWAAEPWFGVRDEDVFPEEFRRFLGLGDELQQVFGRHHGDLFTVGFWQALQRRHEHGELVDVYPYPAKRRLTRAGDGNGD
ncbi:MAG TPA: bifunctional isocitrate dehydrogenase kinase/phosphatase [Candidatus Polarisedimenticolaceae bacterium]|nr:bifunctional isocitrate dehydrogenase kinase/phosphatase [Candidatus Polarisedimenticolaceae bacterium]